MPTHAARTRWWRTHAYALRLAGLFVSVMLSILWIGTFDRTEFGTNIIWLANGLVLSFLLLAPRWRWPLYIAVAFLAMFLSSVAIGESAGSRRPAQFIHQQPLFHDLACAELFFQSEAVRRFLRGRK